MKVLNSNNINFDKTLDIFLLQRKKKINSNSVSVLNIIKDVKKMETRPCLSMKKNLIIIS